MGGRMSRRKGANFEREMANALKPIWPSARRGIGQARSAGEVSDVECTPYWLETKAHARVNIHAAMRQAEAATDGRPCVVISKNNNEPILVTMKLADWMKLFPQAAPLPASDTMLTAEHHDEADDADDSET